MTEDPTNSYGRTKRGQRITDALVEQWSVEAERGYDLSVIRPVGRPLLGSAPAKAFPVRLDPELRALLDQRAERDEKPAAEIVREALRRYLAAS